MATDFAAARTALAQAAFDCQRCWVELADLVESIEQAAKANRKVAAKVKLALDLEYNLTGDCAVTGPLADALGIPVET